MSSRSSTCQSSIAGLSQMLFSEHRCGAVRLSASCICRARPAISASGVRCSWLTLANATLERVGFLRPLVERLELRMRAFDLDAALLRKSRCLGHALDLGPDDEQADCGRHRRQRGRHLEKAGEPVGRIPECPHLHEVRPAAQPDEQAEREDHGAEETKPVINAGTLYN